MIHQLNLHLEPFELILNHQKDIEMRLFDDRRKNIQKGDIIIFTNIADQRQIKAEVISLLNFKSFKELYAFFDKRRLGYKDDEIADYHDMNKYYSDELINKYGVLAIEIKLI